MLNMNHFFPRTMAPKVPVQNFSFTCYSRYARFVPNNVIPEGPVPTFNYINYSHYTPFIPRNTIPEAPATADGDNIYTTARGEQPKYYVGGGEWSYVPF
jgi:hypothetical protein